ncbi:MAG: calcium-binding protein [Alphaproteobacteria bacterium]|nr:calcium-binding protein [Alphaproteobacteria bacterium]
MLGFIADHRLDQFSEYIFRTDDVFDASDFPDLIAGFAGSDVLAGNGGADTIHGVTGDDTIDAGDGSDYALGERGNDSIGGGAGNDLLLGNLGLDTISGGDGNDTIFGGKEYDVLDGGTGDDLVYGDLGGDDLHDGPGNDTLVAGGGTGDVDWFYFASGSGQDRVEQFDIGDGDLLRIQTRINNTTIVDFASLVDRITSDGHGDSIIDLGGANYIRLVGVDRADIDASWFAFDDPPGPSLLGGAAA